MAGRNPQSAAKRARELVVKERRDRKRAKKAEAAAQRVSEPETEEASAISDTEDQP